MTNALLTFLNVAICSGVVAFDNEGVLAIFYDMDDCEGELILFGHTMETGEATYIAGGDFAIVNPTYAQ